VKRKSQNHKRLKKKSIHIFYNFWTEADKKNEVRKMGEKQANNE
jgi:hypothetical protein